MEIMDELIKKIESSEGEVPLDELFDSTFMKRYTLFSSIEEFLNEGDWGIESQEDFERIPENDIDMDEYVRKNTKFKSWDHMMAVASESWLEERLG